MKMLWFKEDYTFKITVLSIKPDNKSENHCRNGHEAGDEFVCKYVYPNGFCSNSMAKDAVAACTVELDQINW